MTNPPVSGHSARPGPLLRRRGIVTFTVDGLAAGAVAEQLRVHNINTAAPMARTSRLDLGRSGLEQVVRASPHYYNTFEEIDRLIGVVAGLAC